MLLLDQGYSLGGLILNVSGKVVANYWLNYIYPPEIGRAHREADFHIHDLDIIVSSFGKPLGVSSSESTKCGDYWSFCYDYGSFKVHAEAGWIKAPIPFSATYRIIFERGVLTYDGSSLKMYEEGGEVVNYDISYDKIISTGINVPPTGWYYEELKEILSLLSEKKESNVKYSEILDVLGILEKF